MSYPSDLSDGQWALLEAFFARLDPRGALDKHPHHHVVEAIFYHLREGCR